MQEGTSKRGRGSGRGVGREEGGKKAKISVVPCPCQDCSANPFKSSPPEGRESKGGGGGDSVRTMLRLKMCCQSVQEFCEQEPYAFP